MLSRISEAIRAKMKDILDNAENPYETFGYAFEKVVESLRDTHALIADVTETKQRLQVKASTMNRTAPALYTEALDAIAAGDEDAARNALQRQHATFLILEELHDKITSLERQQQVLITEIPAVQDSLASLRDELKELPAEPQLTLLPEEKARIRPIIEKTFQLDEQITRILEETASAFSNIHVPETPDTLTNKDAIRLIEIFAPLAAARRIEEQLGYMQEIQPAQKQPSPSEDASSSYS